MSIIVRMSAACWVLLGTSALVGCKQEAWVPRVETPAPAPEPEHPLARELAQLKAAIAAKDADALWKLLDPEGVECDDVLMGPLDFDKLVRAPDGLARPWVFGSKDDKGRNVAKYLETHPTIQTDAPDEQVANFALDGGGMHVGYTRRDGRWLITTGLFCGG